MKKVIIYIALLGTCLLGMNSCELFGLSYAYSFKNERATEFGTLDCTAWQWIESRKDIDMALQYEVIKRTGLDSLYDDTTQDYTFILMSDDGWADYLSSTKASSLQELPVADLRFYLLGYTTYGVTTVKDVDVPLYYTTLNGQYTMRYYKCIVAPTSSQNLNSFYAAWYFGEGISFQNRGCITSNLMVTNGVMHIIGQRLIIKTK